MDGSVPDDVMALRDDVKGEATADSSCWLIIQFAIPSYSCPVCYPILQLSSLLSHPTAFLDSTISNSLLLVSSLLIV